MGQQNNEAKTVYLIINTAGFIKLILGMLAPVLHITGGGGGGEGVMEAFVSGFKLRVDFRLSLGSGFPRVGSFSEQRLVIQTPLATL